MYVLDRRKTQKKYNKVILENRGMLRFISDCYKNQKCLINLLILVILHLIMFLIDRILNKCVTKVFPKKILCENVASIDIRLKKCVINLVMLVCQH